MIEKWRGFFFCQSLQYPQTYFWSEDKGVTWKPWNYPTHPFINNASNHDGSMILGGAEAGYIWNGDYSTRPKFRYSTDHGKLWTEALLPLAGGNSTYSVWGSSFVNDKFYIAGRGLSGADSWPLLESSDGLTWTQVPISSVSVYSPPTWDGITVTYTGQSSFYSYTYYTTGSGWSVSPHGMMSLYGGVWYKGEYWVGGGGFGKVDLNTGTFTLVDPSLCTRLIVHDDSIFGFWAVPTADFAGLANYFRWDGNSITYHTAPIKVARVVYGDGTFIIGNVFGPLGLWYSHDGINWTQATPPTPTDFFLPTSIAFVPNGLIRGGWHIGSIGVGG